MSIVFCSVDTLKDFFGGGKLAVPNADSIRPNLKALTEKAMDVGIPILAFSDAHPEDAPEFDTFPPHCLIGSDGAEQIPETDVVRLVVDRDILADEKCLGQDLPMYDFQKNSYDIFDKELGNPNVDTYLKNEGVTHAVVYGVVTSICVDATVRGLLMKGIEVHVVVDAIMHLDESKAETCMKLWYEQGVYLTTTNIVTL